MLTRFFVDNFKSLKDVSIELPDMGFFCGPNASGKSNLAESFDFVSQVFRNGLSYAVAEKGGFYNMCFRKQRRARGAIHFRITGTSRIRFPMKLDVTYDISFSLQTKTEEIRSEFYVEEEAYTFQFLPGEQLRPSIEIRRREGKYDIKISESFGERMPKAPWLK